MQEKNKRQKEATDAGMCYGAFGLQRCAAKLYGVRAELYYLA